MDLTANQQGLSLHFGWLGPDTVPAAFDLRRCGWTLDEATEPRPGLVALVGVSDLDGADWLSALCAYPLEVRRLMIVVGVRRPHERAAMLQTNFGDAVTDAIEIEELSARARRIAETAGWLPRIRRLGALELDLFARDACCNGRRLNLNPREFALLWRLTDSPGDAVDKKTLLQDVWRIGFVPKTNSIAVHMSRLRGKLTHAGLEGAIETVSSGGYCLRLSVETDRPLSRHQLNGNLGPNRGDAWNGASAAL